MVVYKSTHHSARDMINKHFEEYDDLFYLIKEKNMELIQLKKDCSSLTAVRYDDVRVQGGISHDISDTLSYIIDKENDLIELVKYKEKLRRIHEEEINKIEDIKKRTILKLFYLDKCTVRQIAGCLHLSDGHIKTLKRTAIKEFEEKNKCVK